MPGPGDYRGKQLVAEEYFAAQDPRFLDTLREIKSGNLLGPFAERWATDTRTWAREQLLHYLAMPPNIVGHQVVVKRIFKLAEQHNDDRLVGAFAVLFDRLVRHRRRLVTRFSWRPRRNWEEEVLVPECPKLPGGGARRAVNPSTGEPMQVYPASGRPDAVYFSHATRYYLQRRAYRYFRRIGFRDPTRYLSATAELLARYEDQHLAVGEYLLDSWTLMQIAFRHHPALRFTRDRVRLAPGGNLAELSPAPAFAEHWQSDDAFHLLLGLVERARSRLVRMWARQLLEREHAHALAELPLGQILAYLGSDQSDLEEFALAFFKSNRAVADLEPDEWLALLQRVSPASLDTIVATMREHLNPERLTFEQCLELALSEPAIVAQWGFDCLRQRTIDSRREGLQLADLADARCAALAGEMARWGLAHVGSHENYDREGVTRFFDSLTASVRQAAWEWLDHDDSPGRDDPVLFCRLMETPYSDLRLKIVDLLQRRSLPGEARQGLEWVWTQVLLGVERGGRQKLKAAHQVADAIARDPATAERLLPVLATAVRSVRRPERRAALAAVVELVDDVTQLAPLVAEQLPELELLEPAEER